jgi:hypothetical protein
MLTPECLLLTGVIDRGTIVLNRTNVLSGEWEICLRYEAPSDIVGLPATCTALVDLRQPDYAPRG